MPMTIHVLGAAVWIPGVNETSCIMVENKGPLFILDAGTGIRWKGTSPISIRLLIWIFYVSAFREPGAAIELASDIVPFPGGT